MTQNQNTAQMTQAQTQTQGIDQKQPLRLPAWFKTLKKKADATQKLSKFLEHEVPNSVCQEAKCPNRGECFARKQLTFLILGTVCTRNCKFCSIRHGQPMPPDLGELFQITHAIKTLGLKFVVLTSPNRDDLPDGGASHYHKIVSEIHRQFPDIKVEVLVPDFQGNTQDMDTVLSAKPEVLNHNLETVPRLYGIARKGSLYQRSLDVLRYVKEKSPQTITKTGVMLGLGETHDELLGVFDDIVKQGVDVLTLGQYLKPGKDNLDVARYYSPEEFERYRQIALQKGIRYVFSGPLVRSSYLADQVFEELGIKA